MDDKTYKSEVLCKVCGDKASGKHYGVASCDGCRGFFKRSIRRNLDYICKETGRCIVDVTRRNQCQACRFKKCLQVNMKRDAVQHERAPRAHLTHTTHTFFPLTLPSHNLRKFQPFFAPLPFPMLPANPFAHPYLDASFFPINYDPDCRKLLPSTKYYGNLATNNDNEVTSTDEPLVTTRFDSIVAIDHSATSLFTKVAEPCVENVYETSAKLLFLSVKWATSIPSFAQFSERDQHVLLQESWSELFILTAAQWALAVDQVVLTASAMSRDAADSAKMLQDVLKRLNSLQLDHTEYACLKALMLFKPESTNVTDSNHVEMLQDQTHVMLQDYCASMSSRVRFHHDKRHVNGAARFGKLLLTLPIIQNISKCALEELLFRKTVGDVAIQRLLNDMIKAAMT